MGKGMAGRFDAVVIGAGAAGLMAAATAGARGRRVALIDHGPAGAKILISGGGRCNFTNTGTEPSRFLSGNPRFCVSALRRYTAADFVGLVEKHGIAYHEKTLGQLFCDGSARQIVAMLVEECAAGDVAMHLNTRVGEVSRGDMFRVETEAGVFEAPALVLATGGLSIPKLGATGFSYDMARRFGLPVVPPRPGLVPLTFTGAMLELMQPLSGVALPVVARAGKVEFHEALLFTHRGLSGPAVLQASSYLGAGDGLRVDLVPGQDMAGGLLEAKRRRPRVEVRTALAEWLPQRLAGAMAEMVPGGTLAGQTDKALAALGARLNGWELRPAGSEGYAKAEVTLGGIDTRALSSQTMEAQEVPGLFAVGEAVDVTGWLGGYNFQWAWSSGWCAGQAV